MRVQSGCHATELGARWIALYGARILVGPSYAQAIYATMRRGAHSAGEAGGYFSYRKARAAGGITHAANPLWPRSSRSASASASSDKSARRRSQTSSLTPDQNQ